MELDISNNSIIVYKALSSEIRLNILRLLSNGPLTASVIAEKLKITQSAVSKNVQQLYKANLIQIQTSTNKKEKLLELTVQNIHINLPESVYPEYHQSSYSIPVGNYFNISNIMPSCGMASENNVIKRFDDPSVFLSPQRISAQLLWFSSGEVEYQFPLDIPQNTQLQMLDFSFEISSEFPGSNNNWPSDIQFFLNDTCVGTFSVEGNFSDVRGKYTPKWWDDYLSQYGVLVQLRISSRNSGVNGVPISSYKLSDLNITDESIIKIKFKISKTANNEPHGLTLFGQDFGNYYQDIIVKYYWT